MAQEDFLSRLTFFAAVLTSGFLTARTIVPPNAVSADRAWRKDCMRFANASVSVHRSVTVVSLLAVYYAALAIGPPAVRAALCPAEGAEQRNPDLFSWSPVTAASFAAIVAGAELRRRAYADLGRNFTFGLARPHTLVTDGVYRHIQHPSYTGIALVGVAYFSVFFRLDGVAACFVSARFWPLLQGWSATAYVIIGVLFAGLLGMRVKQEEAMLRELFGKEWEQWHGKTKRFIPGVI